MRLFLDANILVDVALKRVDTRGTPLWMASTLLLNEIYKGSHEGFVGVLSLYIVSILVNPKGTKAGDLLARDRLRGFRSLLKTIDLTDKIIEGALKEHRLMLEDALQFVTAQVAGVEAVVTRNVRHFSQVREEIKILTPEDLMAQSV